MITLLKRASYAFHKTLASGPQRIAQSYISLLSVLSRQMSLHLSARIQDYINWFAWPELTFKPRTVAVTERVIVSIVPHLGEFDQAALFRKKLNYEAPVFKWFEHYAAREYDMVIEIGANVGIYTVFLDTLIKAGRSRLTKVIAFEPSREVYRRLLENLRANNTQHVIAFQAAIGLASGFQSFFEPAARGHLTNGSLIQEFAQHFADTVSETVVLVIAAQELQKYFEASKNTLVKMDVEGFEPFLIAAMAPLINKYHPDLLIEVLNVTADQLDKAKPLSGYRKYLITERGLLEAPTLFSSPKDRDWFLQFSERSPPPGSGLPR
jgi:FkbM family methyltransferase